MMHAPFPDQTVFEFAPVEDVRSPILRAGLEHWKSLRGTRRFPSRQQLRPQAVASVLNNLVLVKVLDGGNDFEFRIVGHTSAQNFRVRRQGRKLSEIAIDHPYEAMRLAGLYRCCVSSKAPVYVRGTVGHDAESANFSHVEAIVLPLGPDDDTVDHVLGFGVYEKRN